MELNGSTRVSTTKTRRSSRLRTFGARAALAALVTTTALAASTAHAQSCQVLKDEIVDTYVYYANVLLRLGSDVSLVNDAFCSVLVDEAYEEILLRDPDNAGFNFWTGVCVDNLEDGDSYEETAEFIVDAFLASDEFAQNPSCN